MNSKKIITNNEEILKPNTISIYADAIKEVLENGNSIIVTDSKRDSYIDIHHRDKINIFVAEQKLEGILCPYGARTDDKK